MRNALALLLLPAASLGAQLPGTWHDGPRAQAPQPTTAAITAADLRTRLYIVADDSMEGRSAGTRGEARAAAYLVRELTRLGLRPAGDGGTYLQAIPLHTRGADTTSTFGTTAGVRLTYGVDFAPYPRTAVQTFLGGVPYGGTFVGSNVAAIYGGRIGDATLVDPALAQGKFVVFGPPAGGGNAVQRFNGSGAAARYAGTAGVGLALLPNATAGTALPALYRVPRDYYDDPAHPWPVQLGVVALTPSAIERLFGRPVDSLTAGAAGPTVDARVAFVERPTESPARNVVAILPGSDPALRNEYVAIGAHYDHVGLVPRPLDHDSVRAFNAIVRPRGADDPPRAASEADLVRVRALLDSLRRAHPARPDSVNNGADDDGSGSVILLELAEAFARAAVKPRRSLLFVWHTAEEKGLYGAQYFTDHPTVPRESIVAQINMDQMGRGDPEDLPPGGENALVVIGSRRLSTELGDVVERVNAGASGGFRLDYAFDRDGDPLNAYCRSDHYMYARYGIPVAFFSAAAWHRDYHMVSDEPQYVAYDRMARIARYIGDVVTAVANLDRRPVVDKPKPDPNGTCRQ